VPETIESVGRYAARARRQGIIALDAELDQIADPFLRKGLTLAVDGVNPQLTRDMLELDSHRREEEDLVSARIFESAGGYSPTFGILGAVLGLIHVMENLGDPDRLGSGIAVAFVATVYGVGAANLLFLPIATKLRARARQAAHQREVALEGVISIQEGLNPRVIEQKLRNFAGEDAVAAQLAAKGHAA
jgi:chemotaxis protein MotA